MSFHDGSKWDANEVIFLPPGSTDPAVLAVTSSEEKKRQSYIHELINTEETYMEDMSVVMDVSAILMCRNLQKKHHC